VRVLQTLRPEARTKYHNRRTRVDGIEFASQREAKRYMELKLLERAGAIRSLVLQERFPLRVNGVKVGEYVADFSYERDGARIVEDVKGYRTREYRLKRRLMKALYGIEIVEV
jgi:hypothetical protein